MENIDNKNYLISQEIPKLVELGKSKGQLTDEEIMAYLDKFGGTAADIESVIKELEKNEVTIKIYHYT